MLDTERRPWRYRCPLCGSVEIRKQSMRSMPDMTMAHHGRRIAERGNVRGIAYYVPRWFCIYCKGRFDQPRDMLYDQA